MAKHSMTEFLVLLRLTGRFELRDGDQIWRRPTRFAAHERLDFGLDDCRGKGLVSRIRLGDEFRLVRLADLVWLLTKGEPPKAQLVNLDGDHRNCRIENLQEVTAFLKQYAPPASRGRSISGQPFPLTEAARAELAYLRDRYYPDPVPLEVLARFERDPQHLRRVLKTIPVKPVAAEERLHYVPDHRPRAFRAFTEPPVKILPEDMRR